MDLPGVQLSIFFHGRKERIYNTDSVISVHELRRSRSSKSDQYLADKRNAFDALLIGKII